MRYFSTLIFLTVMLLVTTFWHNSSVSFGATSEHGATTKGDQGHVDIPLGKDVYERVCSACHDNGLAGAIKITDKATWRSHIHHGVDHMVESVIKGKGAMPARGGDPKLSDKEVESAVHYIIQQTQ
jgi:cytochrome c5